MAVYGGLACLAGETTISVAELSLHPTTICLGLSIGQNPAHQYLPAGWVGTSSIFGRQRILCLDGTGVIAMEPLLPVGRHFQSPIGVYLPYEDLAATRIGAVPHFGQLPRQR
jgi:hypothetical protein